MNRLLSIRRMAAVLTACLVSVSLLTGIAIAETQANSEHEKTNSISVSSAAPHEISAQTKSFVGDSTFKHVAESKYLSLEVNRNTGHFMVTDKRTGYVWKSFPDRYNEQDNQGNWKSNLESPFMFKYVEFNMRKDLAKDTNFNDAKGVIVNFQVTDKGYKLQYEIPNLGFVIPVEVRLGDDYVETRIMKNGLRDEPANIGKEANQDKKARLVSVRLFPFLGAQTSEGEDGYLFLPDGSGAVVDFKENRAGDNNFYSEKAFGDDWAYSVNNSASIRRPVRFPVFGIQSGGQAIIGVIQQGAEYADIVAAPSQTFSRYNWVTADQDFRLKYFQYTDTKKTTGFLTYSDNLIATDRSIRYYPIAEKAAGYVQMAVRYRQYLEDEIGVQPLQVDNGALPLQLGLLGADTEKGFLWDSYLPLTTTNQAKKIVQDLSSLGIERMAITYLGWQRQGYSKYGSNFPLPGKLGGSEGMKQFVDFAHSKGFPVFLDASSSYTYNNTGKGGFRKSRDGLRDIGSSVISYSTWSSSSKLTLVSPRFAEKSVEDDLSKMQALHVDGVLFGKGIGSILNTDFNDHYTATREQAAQVQQHIYERAAKAFGNVRAAEGNLYVLKYIDYMQGLYDDYSNDLFVDRQVPFMQIALHGLIAYSANYANASDDATRTFLKGIEYGGVPSFIVTYAKSQELLKTRVVGKFNSTYYKDWLQEMVTQYQRFNVALGDVQDQFIADHRMLAEGVFETTYANGKRIIVNYNSDPYAKDGITVKPKDFIAVKAGGQNG